ncbi:hypothetical protein C8F01DRAFT_218582 [Mycena amicta]|nr:hypothetical protein C8F01DRAFT_218582 [Mycena amicta]
MVERLRVGSDCDSRGMASFLHALRRAIHRRPHKHVSKSLDPFPDLPVDLQREIFETTALLHPEMAYVLLRVAKDVCGWIEPILYNTIELQPSSVSRMLPALRSKSLAFLQSSVHNVRLYGSIPADALELVANGCTSVTNLCLLGLFSSPAHAKTLAPYLASLRLLRLSVNEHFLTSILTTDSLPTYSLLTHLDAPHLHGASFDWHTVLSPVTPGLPNLTHLRVWSYHHTDEHRSLLLHMLSYLRALRVLIVVPDESTPPDIVARFLDIDDLRIVVMPLQIKDAIKDWRAHALSGHADLWERAEAFVERRRRGEVSPPTRCWLEDDTGPYGLGATTTTTSRSLETASLLSSDCTLPEAPELSWADDVLAAIDPNFDVSAKNTTTASPSLSLALSLSLSPSPSSPVEHRKSPQARAWPTSPQLPELQLQTSEGDGFLFPEHVGMLAGDR